jgi:hypothetical protein
MPDDQTENERRLAIVRKAFAMRVGAMAARGALLQLTDHRVWLYELREDLRRRLSRSTEAINGSRRMRADQLTAMTDQIQDDQHARLQRGLETLENVLLPAIDERIAALSAESNGHGLSVERMIAACADDLDFMGVRNAI